MARYRRQPVRHVHFARELPLERWESADESTRAAIVAGEHGGIAVAYVSAPINTSVYRLAIFPVQPTIFRATVRFAGMEYERDFWRADRAKRFALYESIRLAADSYTIAARHHGAS